MKLMRLASLVLLAAFASAGCRTGGLGNLNPSSPTLPARTSMKASELLEEHNRNAEKIQTFKAKPAITVTDADNRSLRVDGYMVMERPRNFRLKLKAPVGFSEVADIGSNEEEFWFWMKQFEEKGKRAIYFSKYDESGENPLAATFQPDWIVEALGFRVIPDDEMAEMTVKPGREAGTLVLTHNSSAGSNVSFTREMVVSETTHRIKELRIYSADRKPLAQAIVYGDPRPIAIGASGSNADDKVYIPSRLKLEWYQGRTSLDVSLNSAEVNTEFSAEKRASYFVEPVRKGYERVNLADLPGMDKSRTTVRETRPAPAPRVRLGAPAPFGVDGAVRIPRDPVALSQANATTEDVVGPLIPTAPDPEFVRAGSSSSSWRSSRIPPTFER